MQHLAVPGWQSEARRGVIGLVTLLLSGCAPSLGPVTQRPDAPGRPTEVGIASWYGPGFHGHETSSGEVYDQNELTAAHRTLPLGTRVVVTNLTNDRAVEVRINDRGPFVTERIIDLSRAAAQAIDMVGPGTAPVRIALVGAGSGEQMPTAAYIVQVGSFTDSARAALLEQQLRECFAATYVTAFDGPQQTYFRVRIGPFTKRELAVRAAERASRLGLTALIMEE